MDELNNNLEERCSIDNLTFDEIKHGITRKRNEHNDMTMCYKRIYSICENIPEKASKEKMSAALSEIMEIAGEHKNYWE